MTKLIPKEEIFKLLELLFEEGYDVVAPVLRDGVICLEEISSPEEIARWVQEEQKKGSYRVIEGELFFGYVHGYDSVKRFLHPPRMSLMRITPDLRQEFLLKKKRYAFIALRGCDLKAVEILDDVFLGGLKDPYYASLREEAFIVALNCPKPSSTCFCTSMGTGPEVRGGYDVLLSEIGRGFLIRAGSERGEEIVSRLEGREAGEEELREERKVIERAESIIRRRVRTEGLPEKLLERIGSPLWDEIGKRCLACGSCAMVCPTCFCYEVLDEVSLDGAESLRERRWDVCFRESFSAIHGVPLRGSISSRYRQWLMHKFSYWVGQFGKFGCVGCGRCVTWCPVGIDITEEVRRISEDG